MKKLFFLLLAVVFLASCSGLKENSYKITGTAKGIDTGMVYLVKKENGTPVPVDSAKIKKGEFTFEGKVVFPARYFLVFRGFEYQFPFFLENSKINVTAYADSTEKLEVTGSATQDIYKKFLVKEDSINQLMNELGKKSEMASQNGDTAAIKKIDSVFEVLDNDMKNLVVSFAKANNKTVVAPYLIVHNFYRFEYPELQTIAGSLDTSLNKSTDYQAVQTRLDLMKKVQIGMPAVDFTMNDTTGKPFSLSSLKGKILLVDFWASWCRPCRGENPNVVKAYQGFNKKGFDVLGVSLDRDRSRWVKAIKDDNLTWNHVSDLTGWSNAAARVYTVSSIPANVLLDRNQVIIARNLRGEDLQKKLNELLGPPAKDHAKKPVARKK